MLKVKLLDIGIAAALLEASGYADIADQLLKGQIEMKSILGTLASIITDPSKRAMVITVVGVGGFIKLFTAALGMNRGYNITDKITVGL